MEKESNGNQSKNRKLGAGYLAGQAGTQVSDATFENWGADQREAYFRGLILAMDDKEGDGMLGED